MDMFMLLSYVVYFRDGSFDYLYCISVCFINFKHIQE